MIPSFDENGNLPPGIHEATFDEVIARFSLPRSRKRTSRTQKLKAFYQFVRPFALQIYIDGSYTTNKLSPGDVDLLVLLKSDFDFKSKASARLHRFVNDEKTFHLHIFAVSEGHPEEGELWRLVDFFQQNNRENPPVKKGVILIKVNDD